MADGPLINKDDLLPEFWTDASQEPVEHRVVIPEVIPEPPVQGQAKSPDREKQRVVEALTRARGNVRAASKEIGVSRVTLYAHIRRHGLSLDSFRSQR